MLNLGRVYYFHHFLMYHYAGPAVRIPDDQIRDNGGLVTGFGYNFTPNTSFDSLSVSSAFTVSYDQHRSIYELRFYGGNLTEVNAEYKGFGIHEAFYVGDGQVQLMGDSFYSSELYSRTDFYWKPFRTGIVNWKIEISVHYVPGYLDWSQIFMIYYNFNKKWQSVNRSAKTSVE